MKKNTNYVLILLSTLTLNAFSQVTNIMKNSDDENNKTSIIGQYGPWAANLNQGKLPSLSFRNSNYNNIKTWQKIARKKLTEHLGAPVLTNLPSVTINKNYIYDGLEIEEISWQLPYGRPTEAIILKPVNTTGKLPAILALHDHGGNKYFGNRKITKTNDAQHPLMKDHQKEYYEGLAWANEIAKKGYVVMVADAFPFASRRVMMQDIPQNMREGLSDENAELPVNIEKYNTWAGNHESIMAKSLLSAGTTWPGVFYQEDKISLDILCARSDVNPAKIGCGGLSGGGMRTIFLAGQDDRIKAAVCVGFMTTWKDLILNKSFTHTWMTYVPLLPNELDLPEILSLRAPLPTLVLNDIDDGLFTLSEMKEADNIINEVYKKANASEKYKCTFHPGPHKFDKNMQAEAFEWFDKWLK